MDEHTGATAPTCTEEEVTAMREWLADCHFSDLEADDALDPDMVTDAEVLAGVQAHHAGGLAGFLAGHRADMAVSA